mgnify:CR=1 FL=1|tara:strand:- start:46533 stop:48305 length:1773 start_codon:yes stop_codon:yes gene_type:complete
MENIIPTKVAETLDGLFRERAKISAKKIAYRSYNQTTQHWRNYTWEQIKKEIARWQTALTNEGLMAGDRVAIMLRNCPEWVIFDQAALGLGLVVVPIYTEDRAENTAYILIDSGAKLLLLEEQKQWQSLKNLNDYKLNLKKIITINSFESYTKNTNCDANIKALNDWLPKNNREVQHTNHKPNDLATIIYTSGTSGRPKGVMLSHHNILTNANNCLQIVPVYQDDILLSFLPLSHAFERTIGYYLPLMAGATVAYARSISHLHEDLTNINPSILISVPRIYDRIFSITHAKLRKKSTISHLLLKYTVEIGYSRFEFQQKRGPKRLSHLLWPILNRLVAKKIINKLGGRIRLAMAGGAPLSTEVSRMFIGLGLPILQGYGMTECSPVISVNSIKNNIPSSVGHVIPGTAVKLGDNGTLLIHGPNVMLGYWNNLEATKAILTSSGWLDSGDVAHINDGIITITGRLKEIIVLSTGEKVPPADIESAILRDPLFDQVILIGEGRPFLSVLIVINHDYNEKFLQQNKNTEKILLRRVSKQMAGFPGYAKIRRLALIKEPWTIENGMLTPTLKLKRTEILNYNQKLIKQLYVGIK